ncbi:MAG: hypothetical protein FWH03_02255 [Firmicutes bacterium]|nr:hypothetical protein [Bacillota bacterium]
MKIILSRKGFDYSSGGRPSIKNGDCLISIPIPDFIDKVPYKTLNNGGFVKSVLNAFKGKKLNNEDRQFLGQMELSYCHPDPNITDYFNLGEEFQGSIGLTRTPAYLKGGKIEIDDIFLFFGIFKDVEEKTIHYSIWGYLEVGKALCPEKMNDLQESDRIELLRITGNPHLINQNYEHETGNAVYIAKKNCCGVFKYNPELELLDNKGEYKHDCLKKNLPSIKGRGQDYVLHGEAAAKWANYLIETFANKKQMN